MANKQFSLAILGLLLCLGVWSSMADEETDKPRKSWVPVSREYGDSRVGVCGNYRSNQAPECRECCQFNGFEKYTVSRGCKCDRKLVDRLCPDASGDETLCAACCRENKYKVSRLFGSLQKCGCDQYRPNL